MDNKNKNMIATDTITTPGTENAVDQKEPPALVKKIEKMTYLVRVHFSITSKETFMRQYEAGMSPTKIVESMGYDAEMLGKRCINSLYRTLQKQQASPAGLHEGSLRSKKNQPGSTDYSIVFRVPLG